MTGIFPSGFMQTQLTALRLISDGFRLFMWCPRMAANACLAADMSAPESSNTVTGTALDEDVICKVIVGAGSALSPPIL